MESLFSLVAEARARLAQHNAIGAELAAAASEAEAALFEHMRSTGIRTAEGSGLMAVTKVRRDTKIVDTDQVVAALTEMGRLTECQKVSLDAPSVKRVAKELGELLPGMVDTETPVNELRAKA